MEKRISFRDFQSARNVAKTIDPYIIQKGKVQAQIASLDDELREKTIQTVSKLKEQFDKKKEALEGQIKAIEEQIHLYEVGIINMTGFHATDLVKKVIEPTGKTDPKTGKPLKVTKYLPTDIVSYDDENKQFVITVPDDEEPIVPPTTEDGPGSDYDIDVESTPEEILSEETDDNALPFEEEDKEAPLPWEDNKHKNIFD